MDISKFVNCKEQFTYIEESGIKDALAKDTGRERIRRIFVKNEFGAISPELRFIVNNGIIMSSLSGVFGALVEMNKAKEDFIRKNMASTYESQHFGRRALMDTMSLAGIKGGIRYAIQYGGFGSIYLLSTITIETYRNKFSIWEHMGTAAVLGGLSRVKYGAKGMLVASCLGGFLGFIAGGVIMLSTKMTGFNFEEFRYWHHENYYTRVMKKKTE